MFDEFEIKRLQEQAKAWEAVFEAIIKQDVSAFQGRGSGIQLACAWIEKAGKALREHNEHN
jgi:hypothetical protein